MLFWIASLGLINLLNCLGTDLITYLDLPSKLNLDLFQNSKSNVNLLYPERLFDVCDMSSA